MYSYVAKGYEQIEMGVKKVHQMQNMELGEVRIGASDMTLQKIFQLQEPDAGFSETGKSASYFPGEKYQQPQLHG